jgi:hypothetical protein
VEHQLGTAGALSQATALHAGTRIPTKYRYEWPPVPPRPLCDHTDETFGPFYRDRPVSTAPSLGITAAALNGRLRSSVAGLVTFFLMFATVSGSFAIHACRAEATQLARHVAAPRRAVERVPVLVAVDGSL